MAEVETPPFSTGGGVTSIAGGDCACTYRFGGCTMVQDTSGVTGDIC